MHWQFSMFPVCCCEASQRRGAREWGTGESWLSAVTHYHAPHGIARSSKHFPLNNTWKKEVNRKWSMMNDETMNDERWNDETMKDERWMRWFLRRSLFARSAFISLWRGTCPVRCGGDGRGKRVLRFRIFRSGEKERSELKPQSFIFLYCARE